MIVLVQDPRVGSDYIDGGIFEDPNASASMKRAGVAHLPVESIEHYSRAAFGLGHMLMADGACPFGVYTGAGDLDWLYWTAFIVPSGQAPSGHIQLQSDTTRRGVQLGLSMTGPVTRVEQIGATQNGGWVVTGKCRMGSPGGWAPLKFFGSLADARIRVVAASCCKHEYPF